MKDALVDLYEELHQDAKEITGIETGYTSLNKMTCGLQEGDFVVLGARPSMGKTAFALNVGLHAAKSGAAVGLFSLEMSSKQLLKRVASCVGEVSGGRLKNPKHRFAMEDWERVSKAFAEIGELPLEIYDNAGVTVQDIWMQTRKLKRKHGDKKVLTIVAYLQLITGDPKHKGNRFQEISEISRKLKLLARELNVCVVALSQLSRSVESRQDKRPLLSDLRETGQIEQDADLIAFLYREDYYDRETENKNITEIILAKQRNGPVGVVELAFIKEFSKFVNLERKF
ncbi:DnaB-like helicase C-terminal domain-containing protein, partial [Vibrio parahaemolyticus]|nr:DnaB-like helicase C-terminal domain-containing protein [Vibrio parahaemolyticus]